MVMPPIEPLDPNAPILSDEMRQQLQTTIENIAILRNKVNRLQAAGIATDFDITTLDEQEKQARKLLDLR